jgi:hypothetical protein
MNISGNEKFMKYANKTVDASILREMASSKFINQASIIFAKVENLLELSKAFFSFLCVKISLGG